jgi:hypothetical protein
MLKLVAWNIVQFVLDIRMYKKVKMDALSPLPERTSCPSKLLPLLPDDQNV